MEILVMSLTNCASKGDVTREKRRSILATDEDMSTGVADSSSQAKRPKNEADYDVDVCETFECIEKVEEVTISDIIEKIMRSFGDGSPRDCFNVKRKQSVKLVEKFVRNETIKVLRDATTLAVDDLARDKKCVLDIVHLLGAVAKKKYLLSRLIEFIHFHDLQKTCVNNSNYGTTTTSLTERCIRYARSLGWNDIARDLQSPDGEGGVRRRRLHRMNLLSLIMTSEEEKIFISDRSISFSSNIPMYISWLSPHLTKPNQLTLQALSHLTRHLIGLVVDRALMLRSQSNNDIIKFQLALGIEQRRRELMKSSTSLVDEVQSAVVHPESSLYVGCSALPDEIQRVTCRK